jgi:glycosyltransferase involved in cell wall biosynthesis
MSQPTVSIVITNYNYADYVEEAIKSALDQTYPHTEVIVIDDGSTDGSLNVISKYKDAINIISRENKGIVHTRNQALGMVRSDFICFLDADDYFDPGYIENLVKIAERSQADVVYPNWHVFGDEEYRTDFAEFDTQLLIRQKIHCTSESLIRTSSIGSHRFESETVAEDWDFFLGLALSGMRFKLAKNTYINYRVRANTRGAARPYWDDMYSFCEILVKWNRKYPDVVNPFDLPISVGVERDKHIAELGKIIHHNDNCIRDLRNDIEQKHEEINALKRSMNNLKKSIAYRLGRTILYPFIMAKRLTKRFQSLI